MSELCKRIGGEVIETFVEVGTGVVRGVKRCVVRVRSGVEAVEKLGDLGSDRLMEMLSSGVDQLVFELLSDGRIYEIAIGREGGRLALEISEEVSARGSFAPEGVGFKMLPNGVLRVESRDGVVRASARIEMGTLDLENLVNLLPLVLKSTKPELDRVVNRVLIPLT